MSQVLILILVLKVKVERVRPIIKTAVDKNSINSWEKIAAAPALAAMQHMLVLTRDDKKRGDSFFVEYSKAIEKTYAACAHLASETRHFFPPQEFHNEKLDEAREAYWCDLTELERSI